MIPTRVSVVVHPTSFDRTHGRPVTGPIWLAQQERSGGRAAFPEENWRDFPVVVLGWWLAELAALRAGAAGERVCGFMDGPYTFAISDAGPTLLRVRCVERQADGEVTEAEWVTPAREFEASVREAATAALAECVRRGWSDRDVEHLRSAALGHEDRAG